mmetsp:Transcript_5507/g.16006  ORF Transcript_5507/g.16006 Transcript_5507/m.16006 type:complete len:273 (+) Transcript_5507:63-881(+)
MVCTLNAECRRGQSKRDVALKPCNMPLQGSEGCGGGPCAFEVWAHAIGESAPERTSGKRPLAADRPIVPRGQRELTGELCRRVMAPWRAPLRNERASAVQDANMAPRLPAAPAAPCELRLQHAENNLLHRLGPVAGSQRYRATCRSAAPSTSHCKCASGSPRGPSLPRSPRAAEGCPTHWANRTPRGPLVDARVMKIVPARRLHHTFAFQGVEADGARGRRAITLKRRHKPQAHGGEASQHLLPRLKFARHLAIGDMLLEPAQPIFIGFSGG